MPTISRAPLVPTLAYQSNQNINLYSGCAFLNSPRIVLKATSPISSSQSGNATDTSWGPQLNFWCPSGYPITFLQVVPYILSSGQMFLFVEGWKPSLAFELQGNLFATLPGGISTLPAGWTIDWTSVTDPVTGILNKVTITIYDASGTVFATGMVDLVKAGYGAFLAPVSVMTLDLLSDNGSFATFSSGSGTFRYSLGGGQMMGVAPNPPALTCVADSAIHTGEKSNELYSDIASLLPANSVPQQFGLTLPTTIPTTVTISAKPH